MKKRHRIKSCSKRSKTLRRRSGGTANPAYDVNKITQALKQAAGFLFYCESTIITHAHTPTHTHTLAIMMKCTDNLSRAFNKRVT